jgi:hypothetical protein
LKCFVDPFALRACRRHYCIAVCFPKARNAVSVLPDPPGIHIEQITKAEILGRASISALPPASSGCSTSSLGLFTHFIFYPPAGVQSLDQVQGPNAKPSIARKAARRLSIATMVALFARLINTVIPSSTTLCVQLAPSKASHVTTRMRNPAALHAVIRAKVLKICWLLAISEPGFCCHFMPLFSKEFLTF